GRGAGARGQAQAVEEERIMAKARARKQVKAKRPAPPRAKKAAGAVAGAPVGYPTLTPGFCVRGALEALDFYKKAFGATERMRMMKPGGTLAHSELKIGDSLFMLGEEDPAMGARSAQTLGGSSVNFYIYVKAVDAAVEKALAAGAKAIMPVTDMFWGDRIGAVEDP